VRIVTPLFEKRIGTVYRGAGPRGSKNLPWGSFDGYLQSLVTKRGARVIRERVMEIGREGTKPVLKTDKGSGGVYDLLAVSVGVNSSALKLFSKLDLDYVPPCTAKTFIREYHVGQEMIRECIGSSMHLFLLDIPGLEFAALIPKGEHVSLCMLGDRIDKDLLETFLGSSEVRQCLPPDFRWDQGPCQCSPKISIKGAFRPFADRLVFIGDSGETRLYKDGIGAAYRTSKAAATTAVLHGIGAEAFRRHYWPVCRTIKNDNSIGKLVFAVTTLIQKNRFARRGILRMVRAERDMKAEARSMSTVLWDTFTGSAPYRDIFKRTLKPSFLARLLYNNAAALLPGGNNSPPGGTPDEVR
jgi:hypothetical protein